MTAELMWRLFGGDLETFRWRLGGDLSAILTDSEVSTKSPHKDLIAFFTISVRLLSDCLASPRPPDSCQPARPRMDVALALALALAWISPTLAACLI